MPSDVAAAFEDVARTHGGLSAEAAASYVRQLELSGSSGSCREGAMWARGRVYGVGGGAVVRQLEQTRLWHILLHLAKHSRGTPAHTEARLGCGFGRGSDALVAVDLPKSAPQRKWFSLRQLSRTTVRTAALRLAWDS
eukprot:364202-Chlamydomonas_euryale.AAC.2